MIKRFISLEWKSFFRSASLGKSIGLKILMIFLAIYFAIIFLLSGIGLYPFLQNYYPNEDPLLVANRFILVWLLVELALRFFLQTLPVLDVKPLLILPVKKRRLVNFVLLKSLFSFFNFLPLLIIVPFGIFNIIKSDYSTGIILAWMTAMLGFTLSINYANFIIKIRFTENLKALLPVGALITILALLDYWEIFEITYWFGQGLNYIIPYPFLAIVPLIVLLSLFLWTRKNLESRFYLDGSLRQRSKGINTTDFLWTRKFGDLAPYLQQDLKMLWRNKRPKTTIYLSLLLLFYGLIFYPQETYQSTPAFLIFVGVFITGVFMINFGQFIPAWDASHYPMIISQNIPMNKYLTAKAALITFSIIILTILATPYIYFGWRIFMINVVCAVYNIGVNIPLLLYAGSYNRKRIDLDRSPIMNYQGMGAMQWLLAFPLLVTPVLLFWLFNKFLSFESGMAVLFILGIIGVAFRSHIINFIAQVYKRNKYLMIEGFKQKGD